MHYDVSEYKNYGASRKNGLQKGGQNVKINFSFYLLSSRALLKFSSFYCCRSEDFFGKLFSKWRQPLHLAVDINFFRHKATAFFSANFFLFHSCLHAWKFNWRISFEWMKIFPFFSSLSLLFFCCSKQFVSKLNFMGYFKHFHSVHFLSFSTPPLDSKFLSLFTSIIFLCLHMFICRNGLFGFGWLAGVSEIAIANIVHEACMEIFLTRAQLFFNVLPWNLTIFVIF